MDGTLKFFDLPSNRTVDNCGAKTATVKTTGHERTHFTTALSCVADHAKLPLMIIFKKKQHQREIPTWRQSTYTRRD